MDENLEVVRRSLDAFMAGDFDAALDDAHADVVLEMADEDPLHRQYAGRERVKAFWKGLVSFWEDWSAEPEHFEAAGDTVVVVYRVVIRTREARVPIRQRMAQLVELRDGKVSRTKLYGDPAQALAALRLTETDREGNSSPRG